MSYREEREWIEGLIPVCHCDHAALDHMQHDATNLAEASFSKLDINEISLEPAERGHGNSVRQNDEEAPHQERPHQDVHIVTWLRIIRKRMVVKEYWQNCTTSDTPP